MIKIKDGGSAFPRPFPKVEVSPERAYQLIEEYKGMSLRDYFAGQVIQTVCTDYRDSSEAGRSFREALSYYAYAMADAMLAMRDKGRA